MILLAGVLVLATGCVKDRVTYVQTAYSVPVPPPQPPPPRPMAMPPVQALELPPAPPPAPMATLRSRAELDTMLAPIALYPDPLLAQLLPAATLPEQVVLANRYLRMGGDPNQIDFQPWDNSLKAMARYPATLRWLDDNLAWTTDLGQAFLNQPAEVMDSVQRLRAQARALGNLISTPQQTILVNDGLIEIVPAAPQVIYVPVYEPEVVYVRPPPAPGRFYVSFGAGLVVGAWLNHDCDWQHHEVIVWHHDRPRPSDWWYRPPSRREAPRVVNNVTVVNNTTIVNQNVTVWHPRTRTAVADHGDRGWGQPAVRTPAPARNEGTKPARGDMRQPPVAAQVQEPVPHKEVRPTPPVREARPSQPEVQRPAARAPLEAVKPTPVIPSREARATPPAKETPPAPMPPREANTVKPPVAKAPAPETAQPSNDRPALAREVKPAPRTIQPIPTPKDTRPVLAPVAPKQPSVVTSTPRAAVPPAMSHSAARASVRPQAGALAGVESSRVTHETSARGQQSRAAMAKPSAAARTPLAPVPSPKANASETRKPQKAHEN